ncbi:MAG: hypothetical protein R3Y63_14100 [Eubacteriales bacterium]
MKKFIALLLTSVLCTSMVACSSDSTTDVPSAQPTEGENSSGTTTADSSSETTTDEKQQEITFEEIVAVDNEECVINITGIDPDNMWGYSLNVNLENKSVDKTYMYTVKSASINGVEADPLFATEVAPEKKANKEINFNTSNLEEAGIHEFTDIEITFRVSDSNDWMADDVGFETVNVYPSGQENATQFIREPQPDDTILLDNEYVTAIVTGYEVDSIWGYTANLFLVNKTDKNVMFSTDEVSVNGYMVNPFFANSVSAGKCSFASMSWSDTMLTENGISEIDEIEFQIRAYDSDDFMSEDFAKEIVTLTP